MSRISTELMIERFKINKKETAILYNDFPNKSSQFYLFVVNRNNSEIAGRETISFMTSAGTSSGFSIKQNQKMI